MNNKIFGVGLNKTGTTTLGECGKILGLRGVDYDRGLLEDVSVRNDFSRVYSIVEKYDLFEDWPWPLIYRQLDARYPQSKFILTVRKSENAWLQSLIKHSTRTPPFRHCRGLAYGYPYPMGQEKRYLTIYRRHNDEVRKYFSSRKDRFIELCWENGDGWEKLCNFLGVPIPEVPFPHANKSKDQKPSAFRVQANRLLALGHSTFYGKK